MNGHKCPEARWGPILLDDRFNFLKVVFATKISARSIAPWSPTLVLRKNNWVRVLFSFSTSTKHFTPFIFFFFCFSLEDGIKCLCGRLRFTFTYPRRQNRCCWDAAFGWRYWVSNSHKTNLVSWFCFEVDAEVVWNCFCSLLASACPNLRKFCKNFLFEIEEEDLFEIYYCSQWCGIQQYTQKQGESIFQWILQNRSYDSGQKE